MPSLPVLLWSFSRLVPLSSENSLLPLLLKHRHEVGSFCFQPQYRLPPLQSACASLQVNINTALSLRRHHIKARNRGLSEHQLNMGTSKQKQLPADAFEGSVASYLDSCGRSDYLTEEDQRAIHPPEPGSYHPGTPDFRFPEPLLVADPETGNTLSLNWIEVKHFYGASTINTDGKSACGKIPSKAKQYTANFGPGAFVFAYGCGQDLAAKLECAVLDESVFSMSDVAVEVGKFCRRRSDGMVLP